MRENMDIVDEGSVPFLRDAINGGVMRVKGRDKPVASLWLTGEVVWRAEREDTPMAPALSFAKIYHASLIGEEGIGYLTPFFKLQDGKLTMKRRRKPISTKLCKNSDET